MSRINRWLASIVGLRIVRQNQFTKLQSEIGEYYGLREILKWSDPDVPNALVGYVLKNLHLSRAQIQQDLLVLYALSGKDSGYFVEFGATDGILRSNTYLLEKNHNWSGILAEPGRNWLTALKSNRSAHITNLCVSDSDDQEIEFFESTNPEYSTIAKFRDGDYHIKAREFGQTYSVKSITLRGLLRKFNAPQYIDYISIDTEGSEYEILSSFSFNEYSFGVITVEHNFNSNRSSIHSLLLEEGYIRVLESVSEYDDWYINPKYINPKVLDLKAQV
jgi:FkbM family methyltransferase